MEGEEEQDKGIGAWGDVCPTPPPPRVLGKNSLPLRSLLVVTRHRAWSNSPYRWDPCPPVSGLQFRGFCPPTPLWNYGSSWMRAPTRDHMVMELSTWDDHPGESQRTLPPYTIGHCTTLPRFSPTPQATRYGERPGSPTRVQLIIYHTKDDK